MYSLEKAVNKYIRHLRRVGHLTDRTIKFYYSDLSSFSTFLGNDLLVHKIDNDVIDSYFIHLERKIQFSERTLIRKVCSIRRFLKYLEEEKIAFQMPIVDMPKFQTGSNSDPKPMSENEIKIFFDIFKKEFESLKVTEKIKINRGDPDLRIKYKKYCSLRNNLMFKFMLLAGLKPGEIINLEPENVRISNSVIKILVTKIPMRRLTISDSICVSECRNLVKIIASEQYHSKYFFFNRNMNAISSVSIQKEFKKYTTLANLSQSITPSSLRHSFAKSLIEQNFDLVMIQKILGYKSLEGILIYKPFFNINHERKRS